MKILLDTCVWGGAVRILTDAGHDVIWTGSWERDPGDDEILAFGVQEGRVLITLDNDYGDLIFLRGMTHCGLIRLVGFRARQQGEVCLMLLDRYHADLTAQAIVTAEPGRVRIRRRP